MGWADPKNKSPKKSKRPPRGKAEKKPLTKEQIAEFESPSILPREDDVDSDRSPEDKKPAKGRKPPLRERLRADIEKVLEEGSGFPIDGEGNEIGLSLRSSPSLGFVGEGIRDIITMGLEGAMEDQAVREKASIAAKEGEVDGIVSDKKAMKEFVSDDSINIKALSQLYTDTPFMLALKKKHKWAYNHAKVWRPVFLAALSLAPFKGNADRRAGVTQKTRLIHERSDPCFRQQVEMATRNAAELLHMRAWKSAVEGNLVPIYFQGVCVGYEREYDSGMTLALLRAHLPEMFKNTEVKQSVNVNASSTSNTLNVIGVSRDKLHELQERRKAALEGRPPPTITIIKSEVIE